MSIPEPTMKTTNPMLTQPLLPTLLVMAIIQRSERGHARRLQAALARGSGPQYFRVPMRFVV